MLLSLNKSRCNLCKRDKYYTIEKYPINLVICKTCSLIFIKNTKEIDSYKELYRKHYGFVTRTERNRVFLDKKNIGYVNWIKKNLNKKGRLRLLEIGCSCGYLLQLFRNEQFEVYGIEPGERAVEYARTQNGLSRIENCSLEETEYPHNFFDIIVLVQTFEHFINPMKSLFKIRELLNGNGLLFIEVPDAFSIIGVYRWGLEPSHNHLYIYSRDTIKWLLNKCGFKIVNSSKINFANIRIVAKENKTSKLYLNRYKNSYIKFLFLNRINKSILKIVLKFGLIKRIIMHKYSFPLYR